MEIYPWERPSRKVDTDWDTKKATDGAYERIPVTPSQFVETAIQMPNPHTRRLESFSFAERGYLQHVYDCQAP